MASVSGILAHGVDLTERQYAESALQASREALALAIDGAELGNVDCNMPLDKIVSLNDRCKEHFFLPSDVEVDFTLFYALLHPDDREPTRQAIERCLNARVQYNVEYRTVSPDGAYAGSTRSERATIEKMENPIVSMASQSISRNALSAKRRYRL